MGSKNDFNFMFEFEPEENEQENTLEAKTEDEFEDIVSDSRMKSDNDSSLYFNSFSSKGKYSKKPRGFAGWWKRRKVWQKASMITALSLILVFSIALGVLFTVFDYNYNEITTKPEDLGFENVLDKNIVNVSTFKT